MRRTIVIGDIHGCYDELMSLLDAVKLEAGDRVIAVGDLIVKGNKSKDVLDCFINNQFATVIGNHDRAILDFWQGHSNALKDSQARTCKELESDRKRYQTFLASLPFMIDLGSHLVVHAGIRPGIPLEQQSPEDLTQLRTLGADPTSKKGTAWYEVYDQEKIVLFGHWPSSEPRRAKRAIGLDTGCVYGNRLTAYIIEQDDFISVPARRVYESPKSTVDAN